MAGGILSDMLGKYQVLIEDNLDRIKDARCKSKVDKYSADEFVGDTVAFWCNIMEAWKVTLDAPCCDVETNPEMHISTETDEADTEILVPGSSTVLSYTHLRKQGDASKTIPKPANYKVTFVAGPPAKLKVNLTGLKGIPAEVGTYYGTIELDKAIITLVVHVT